MSRQIRRVGFALLVGFLAVFVQLNYVQIFAAHDIAGNPANRRALLKSYAIKRGDILTVNGRVVATSRETGGKLKYLRSYPGGELFGHITGWFSLIYGTDRIERTYNDELLGEGGVLTMQDIQDRLFGDGEQGESVRLTIHSRLQEVARTALADQRGAVVALDPQTGEVRAMWSNPSFDPGPLGAHDPQVIREYWRSLDPTSRTSPLHNIATSRAYPPGSTFKVVTAAAALESGKFTLASTFPDTDGFTPPQTTESIDNFSGGTCIGGGEIDLATAFRVSCNTTFARLGLEVPAELVEITGKLGFNARIPFDIPTEASTFTEFDDDDLPGRAQNGIGQRGVFATPLQMALVTAGVANRGAVPTPRLVREIRDPSGTLSRVFEPEPLSRAMSPEVASQLTEMMISVVESGTGTAAQIEGVTVAGKTGTAQPGIEGQDPHAWFIAFAPAENPQLAIAVIVEHGGSFGSEATGGAVAAPIARQILLTDKEIRGW